MINPVNHPRKKGVLSPTPRYKLVVFKGYFYSDIAFIPLMNPVQK